MGCGCGKSVANAQSPVNGRPANGATAAGGEETKHLVQFVGDRQGTVSIRVRSGTVYHFLQPARAALVAPRDIAYFRESDSFEVKPAP